MLISPISLPQDLRLLQDPVSQVRKSEVYVLTARRNAWHSTMINRYKEGAAIFTTSTSAKLCAHDRRIRGTYFEVDEVPALVFDLKNLSLVVTHLNVTPPFKTWHGVGPASSLTPLTGIETLNIFASRNYQEFTSGWRRDQGEPTVIMGMVEGDASVKSSEKRSFQLERSYVDSGWMSFKVARKTRVNTSHLDRIIEQLDKRTYRRFRVHELAAVYGTKSSIIITLLGTLGVHVKGPSSWVDADIVTQIRPLIRKGEPSAQG